MISPGFVAHDTELVAAGDVSVRGEHGVRCRSRRAHGRDEGLRAWGRGDPVLRTGTVAVAAAARLHTGDLADLPVTYRVETTGGQVDVELTADQSFLTGPAVIVAHGDVVLPEEG